MTNEEPMTWEEREALEREQYEAEREAYRQRRREFRTKLFGTDDPVALLAPQSLDDYDTLLGEHAAQLRSAIRYAMEGAIADDTKISDRIPMLTALTGLVRTNLAIAKQMKKDPENSTL